MIELNDKLRGDIRQMGALRWDEGRIAALLGITAGELRHILEDPENEVSRLLLQGELEEQLKMESKLLSEAQAGNLAASKDLRELLRDRSFRLSKLDIFGGAEDPGIFGKVQKYITDGAPGTLSTKEQLYLDVLQMIYSLSVKFGDRKTVRLLTRPPYSLSYQRAKDMMAESIELFNAGRHSSKEAMRYHTAETYDALYHTILENARGNQDLALAASVLDKKVKILQLDQPDPVKLPPEAYRRSYRISQLTPEALGLPAADRNALAAQIDAIPDISDHDRRRLKMEGGVIDTDITELLYNVAEKKSQD